MFRTQTPTNGFDVDRFTCFLFEYLYLNFFFRSVNDAFRSISFTSSAASYVDNFRKSITLIGWRVDVYCDIVVTTQHVRVSNNNISCRLFDWETWGSRQSSTELMRTVDRKTYDSDASWPGIMGRGVSKNYQYENTNRQHKSFISLIQWL